MEQETHQTYERVSIDRIFRKVLVNRCISSLSVSSEKSVDDNVCHGGRMVKEDEVGGVYEYAVTLAGRADQAVEGIGEDESPIYAHQYNQHSRYVIGPLNVVICNNRFLTVHTPPTPEFARFAVISENAVSHETVVSSYPYIMFVHSSVSICKLDAEDKARTVE